MATRFKCRFVVVVIVALIAYTTVEKAIFVRYGRRRGMQGRMNVDCARWGRWGSGTTSGSHFGGVKLGDKKRILIVKLAMGVRQFVIADHFLHLNPSGLAV